jgi:6-pyruvoyl-tetrahydropterin synthase
MEALPSSSLHFEAAVERPLSAVFRTGDGRWEGHDFTVQVIASRQGLDGFDVVVDFRELEAALDQLLEPFQGRLLSELGLEGPLDLARKLALELACKVPPPARISEVALTDGRGRRLSLRP